MRLLIVCIIALIVLPAVAQDRNEGELRKVRRMFDQGKVYPGLRQCDALLARDMPKGPVLLLRAEGHVRVKEHLAALDDARLAMAAGLDAAALGNAWFWTGMAWSGLQQGDSAEAAFRRAPAGPERDLRLAIALGMAGRCDEAVHVLDALVSDVASPAALRERGACLSRSGDTARARMDLDGAIALAPDDPVNWNSRGFLLHALHGEHELALADYARALKLNPNYTYAINNRGYSRLKLGQLEKARRDVELAGRRDPGNPYVDHNLGLIAGALGDHTRACAAFRSAAAKGGTPLYGEELAERLKECPPPVTPVAPVAPLPAQPAAPPARNAPGGRNAP